MDGVGPNYIFGCFYIIRFGGPFGKFDVLRPYSRQFLATALEALTTSIKRRLIRGETLTITFGLCLPQDKRNSPEVIVCINHFWQGDGLGLSHVIKDMFWLIFHSEMHPPFLHTCCCHWSRGNKLLMAGEMV